MHESKYKTIIKYYKIYFFTNTTRTKQVVLKNSEMSKLECRDVKVPFFLKIN